MIEQIEIRKTLKAGKMIWEEGTVLDIKDGPLPPDILMEVQLDRGTVKVLKEKIPPVGKPPKMVVNNTSPTSVGTIVTFNKTDPPKPIPKRRRRL